MVLRNLFASHRGTSVPSATALNEAGGKAYQLPARHALAQFAATGTLSQTFYAGAEAQLERVLEVAGAVEPRFVAQTAIFARERGLMKTLPALLTAHLATRDVALLRAVFPRVIDNGVMLRNFVQMIRSGRLGRKSMGTAPKRLVQRWIEAAEPRALLAASVGRDPSLADVIKMVHPRPVTPERRALLGYLIGRPVEWNDLPDAVRQLEAFRSGASAEVPDAPWQLLTSGQLDKAGWKAVARRAGWQMTRMNLNTFARHGVLDDPEMVNLIARRLADPVQVQRARAFPYQLLIAAANCRQTMPAPIGKALEQALEIAVRHVPEIPGKVYVALDVSGSMQSPVTGYERGRSSAARCVDVAALIAAAVLRKNRTAEVLAFGTEVVPVEVRARHPVMVTAEKLAALNGGGTDCGAPMRVLNARRAKGDCVIYVSDNQSWQGPYRGAGLMPGWAEFRARNPAARLVCIDIQPYGTVQAPDRAGILNIGGFSDEVFRLIRLFVQGRLDPAHWVGEIEAVAL